ncbi:transcriptional regulator, DeoR family [Rubellimicrobium thermophilum DSM 16684]|uniref:Transcriptional regulator, DeoR family n=2 Tax=Rubellimicrobium TaxID=295418 RepID=S9R284_9RHOB|nr:transcriptional regulator, DeoR family [Rubellimicrobium thermophilum DSM 16684]
MGLVPADSRHARQITRRQMIAEAVMAEGTMRIEDLAERFGISLMTAHRDLDDLASRGLLRKSRGLVSAAPTSLIEASYVYRSLRQSAEKRALAKAALAHVEPGQAIFLDCSTTVLQMAPYLSSKVPLTAITYALPMMDALHEVRDITLLGLGGQFYNWCNAFLGHITTMEIRRLRADVAFLSLSAITDGLAFHQSPEMVDTKRAMFDCAAKRVLLADHTKFERRALYAMCALEEFDVVIVDDATPPRTVAALHDRGVNVEIAPRLPEDGNG